MPIWSIQVFPPGSSVGTELNDQTIYAVPFPALLTDQASATPRIQKLLNAAPAYTGKSYGENTVVLRINVLPAPGDASYADFETKLDVLRKLFPTRVDDLFTLRLQRPGKPAMVTLATAKTFAVNQSERYVSVTLTIPDAIWLAQAISSQNYNILTSGQKLALTSAGTTDTFPLFVISWNQTKTSLNPQGSFYSYQIPIAVTNNALTAMSNFPIDISGYMSPPTFAATAGGGGSIGAGAYPVQVTALRLSPSGATVETNATSVSLAVGASGSVTTVVNTMPDALGYNVYVNNQVQNPGALKYSILQPSPFAATASLTVNIIAVGAACPTQNQTGWDTAALVSAGKLKADLSDVRVLVGGVESPYTLVPPSGSNTCSRLWTLFNLGTQETTNIFLQYGNSHPSAPPPYTDPGLPSPANLAPILDMANSSNYQWTWQQFADFQNTTRPGTWSPVQNVGVGYNWQQDNNIVRRGTTTAYAAATPIVNGTFSTGNLTGWSAGTTGAVAQLGNARLSSYDLYACSLPAAGTFSQVVPVTAGLQYRVGAWLFTDIASNATFSVIDSNGSTVLFSYVGQGFGAYEDVTFNINLNALPVFVPSGSTVTVKVVVAGAGNTWIDDILLYPDTDVVTRAALSDPADDHATCLGMLHSAKGINNLETPLNGWEIAHPCGVSSVTHYGLTSLVGSDYLNNNVLRLVATDATRPPVVIWGQAAITDGGTVAYATAGSPRVHVISPSRARVRFEINASVQTANNGDGTFAAIQGVTVGIDPRYGPSMVYQATQALYDLNCTLTDVVTGNAITLTTPLEPKATLTVDTQNHAVIYTDPNGVQTNRPSALTLNSLRAVWMQVHSGVNTFTYTEDVLGGVQVQIQWQDAWS